jgi:hypothetical protein
MTTSRSLDDARERAALDRAFSNRAIAWGAVLLVGLLAATWFIILVARVVSRYFAAD